MGDARRFGYAVRARLRTHDDYRVARADVRIGPIRSEHEMTEFYGSVSRGSESTTVEAAILNEGLTAIYRMTVDYADQAIWLDPAQDAPARPYTRTGIFAAKQQPGLFVVASVLPHSSGARADVRPLRFRRPTFGLRVADPSDPRCGSAYADHRLIERSRYPSGSPTS